MKTRTFLRCITWSLPTICITSLTSCFKEEPLNAECDIEQAYICPGENLDKWFDNASDTLVNVQSDQTQIEFTMKGAADLSSMAPRFHITPGATISPESGSTQDFSKGAVNYTVTSEDKQWSRTYQITIKKRQVLMDKQTRFDFENAYLAGGYYSWREILAGDTVSLWATGNAGFKLSNSSTLPDAYPTAMTEDGYEGKGVKLTTRRTSSLADMVKKPIAAGNLFIGQFDATNALLNAMKATKFGRPFYFASRPLRIEGWYKYKAGETFTDKDMNVLAERHDYGTIYAVLYDNHDANGNAVKLYGDNVQTSKQVVAIALVGDTTDDNGKTAIGNTPQWQYFSVNFDYQSSIDTDKLRNGGYSLAIVCSSSTCGGDFMGSVGSTLWVDSFKIICE